MERATNPNTGQRPHAKYDYLVKTVVVGNPAVGKTSFISRLAYDWFTSRYEPTRMTEYKIRTLEFNSFKFKFQFWENGGKTLARGPKRHDYRGAMAVLICFAVDDARSFACVPKWLAELDRHAHSDPARVLVACKGDLPPEEWLVPRADVQAFARKHALVCVETSAKTGANTERVCEAAAWLMTQEQLTREATSHRPVLARRLIERGLGYSEMPPHWSPHTHARCPREVQQRVEAVVAVWQLSPLPLSSLPFELLLCVLSSLQHPEYNSPAPVSSLPWHVCPPKELLDPLQDPPPPPSNSSCALC
eukprot:TRINITY_DN8111_c0_g1_i1.p1 TRINITY_DN8111_c0_g1~~TRINITY_DN8111_c0_g1_i1.p1  ORF type:complete len:305 (-),score=52.48 TRINITY_DN8111_c0_g1_i1:210-1124(-)